MRLVHYSDKPLGTLIVREPPGARGMYKPCGLWVSDDDCADNWKAWCIAEDFCRDRLTHVHDVELTPHANVRILRTAEEIDAFTHEWLADPNEWPTLLWTNDLRWSDMRLQFDGLIITPYIQTRRLDSDTRWYYGWDVAGGCIWHPRAIASVTLREVISDMEE